MARCARALFEVVAVAAQHRPGRGGNTALVGAALRAVRIPTNMGVAQLTSHSPLYPNSRMRPIFSFPAAPAAAVTPEACPYHANRSVGATLPASVPSAHNGRLGRGGTPCRPHPTDASERRPYQHHARLAFTLHKQKPAAFLPRALSATTWIQAIANCSECPFATILIV